MMNSKQEDTSECNYSNAHHPPSNNELEKGEAKEEDYIRCSRCEQQVMGEMYHCPRCAYYIHTDCLGLPKQQHRHPLHPHADLALVAESQDSSSHCCFGCPKRFGTSFLGYKCTQTGCTRKLDVKCTLLHQKINTGLHSHTLEFYYVNGQRQACNRKGTDKVNVLIEDLSGKNCTVCELPLIGPVKGCESCDFWIHKACEACELPPSNTDIAHDHQHVHRRDHSLVFLSAPPFLNRCGACGLRVVRNTLHCKECSVDFHFGCATRKPSLPHELLADKVHHHDLTFFPDPAPFFRCYACKGYSYKSHIYRCVECDFNLHKACIQFLPTVNKPKIRGCSLSLYEDFPDYKKLLCGYCKEAVNPNPGGYCYSSCDFYIHLKCISKLEADDDNQVMGSKQDKQSEVLVKVMPIEPLVRWTIESSGKRHVDYRINELRNSIEATLAKLNLEKKILMERWQLNRQITK